MCILIHVYVYTCIFMYEYVRICTCKFIYIYIYICTPVLLEWCCETSFLGINSSIPDAMPSVNMQISDWLAKGGVPSCEVTPLKNSKGPQQVVADGTSKSGGGTGNAIHAILSSILTQVLQLLVTSSCPRRPHPQLSHCCYFSIPHLVD